MGLGDRQRNGPVGHQPHVPSLAEARAPTLSKVGPDFDQQGKGGISDVYEFDLDYVDDRRGLRWTGHFKTHVLNGKEQIGMGLVLAQLRGGQSPHSLDLTTLQLTEMYAFLTMALTEAPKWAKGDKLMEIHDINVIGAIYQEARDHEARFWGADSTGTGAEHGGGSAVADGDHPLRDDRETGEVG